jgi:thiol-disulfide isomerase/thioredoxin
MAHHVELESLTQEVFEELISKDPSIKKEPIVIIKFSATWCGPCKKVDMKYLTELSDKIKWYHCDLDENDYTPGYAGVKKIPAFLAIVNGVPQKILQCSDTQKIADWMKSGFKQALPQLD